MNPHFVNYPDESLSMHTTTMVSLPNASQQVLVSNNMLPRKMESLLDLETLGDIPAEAASRDVDQNNSLNTLSVSPLALPMGPDGQLSPMLPLDHRHDLLSRGYYSMGLSPLLSFSGSNMRGLSIVSMLPGYWDSISGLLLKYDTYGRLRNDSVGARDTISIPPTFSSSKTNEGEIFLRTPTKSATSGNEPLRSTSIFSSLIQLPPSAGNSVSGHSEKKNKRCLLPLDGKRPLETLSDYESDVRDAAGYFSWHPDHQRRPLSRYLGSRRRTRSLENSIAIWDLLNLGVRGSISSVNSESLNQFLASAQNNGNVDLMSTLYPDQWQSFIGEMDSNGRPDGRLLSALSMTSLREDIFEEKGRSTSGRQARRAGVPTEKPLSPTSSFSSKTSKRNDEALSPRALMGGHSENGTRDLAREKRVPGSTSLKRKRNDALLFQQYSGRYPMYEGSSGPSLSSKFHSPPGNQDMTNLIDSPFKNGPLDSLGTQTVQNGPTLQINAQNLPVSHNQNLRVIQNAQVSRKPQNLQSPQNLLNSQILSYTLNPPRTPQSNTSISAQRYAQAEDGRPLLGATKVDQLMLVIQAREKSNTATIPQAADGSIFMPTDQSQSDNPALSFPVDLVAGITRPPRSDGVDDGLKKKRRKGKRQECPYCLKTFNQATHLDVHVRSHIGYKPFQCTVCQKRFTQGGNLRTHMRLHTGEKPFSCSVCDRSFSRKGNLAAHMLTHKNEKPFECKLDNCGKTFTQLGNLKTHQNKFHLSTLTRLTNNFASLTGEALVQLPKEEKDLMDYFANLYKNSNKGIRGRGKVKPLLMVNDQDMAASASIKGSPTYGYEESYGE